MLSGMWGCSQAYGQSASDSDDFARSIASESPSFTTRHSAPSHASRPTSSGCRRASWRSAARSCSDGPLVGPPGGERYEQCGEADEEAGLGELEWPEVAR